MRRSEANQSRAKSNSGMHRARLLPRVLLAVPPLLLLLLLRLLLYLRLSLLLLNRCGNRHRCALPANSCHGRGGLRLRGLARTTRMVLQTLVLPTRQQPQALSAVLARMLVMVPKPVHVLVPPLTRWNLTTERLQPLLGLLLG